jgi:hypothetical protein
MRLMGKAFQKVLSTGNWSGKSQPRAEQKYGGRAKRRNRSGKTSGSVDSVQKGQHLGVSIPRGLAHSPFITITGRDVITVANSSTAGITNNGYALSVNSVAANGVTLGGLFSGTFMPRVASFSALYREFKLINVRIEFVPSVSTTQGGAVAMGFDPDPYAGLPSSYSDPTRHTISAMTDLQSKATLNYSPTVDQKIGVKYVSNAGSTRPINEVSYSTFQLYSNNSLGAGAIIGSLIVSATLRFIGPC